MRGCGAHADIGLETRSLRQRRVPVVHAREGYLPDDGRPPRTGGYDYSTELGEVPPLEWRRVLVPPLTPSLPFYMNRRAGQTLRK